MKLLDLYAAITLDTEKYDKGVKRAVNQGEELRKQLKTGLANAGKAAAAGIGVASGAIVSLGKIGLDYNKQMESYTTNFSVMLGDNEKAIQKVEELKRLGASTPFEMADLAQATQTLLAFNVSADESSGILTRLGDISLGNVQKFESLTRAYGKMNASQKVSLEDINIMIDAGFNPLLLIAEKTGESMTALYKRVSDGAVAFSEVQSAIETATSEGGQFFNGMQEASQTTEGMISTLSDNVKSKIGEAFQNVSAIIQDSLLPKAIEFVDSVDTEQIVEEVQAAIQTFKDFIPVIAGATTALVTFKTAVAIASFLDKLRKATEGVTTAQQLFNAVLGANPIFAVISLVTGLVAALVTLYATNEEFRVKVNAAWQAVKETVMNAAAAFEGALGKFFDYLVYLGPKIDDFLDSIPKKMRQVGSDLLVGLWNGISDKVAWLKDKVSSVVDKIKSWFTGKDGFDEHSPSRWANQVFRYVMEGGANGLEAGSNALYRTANKIVGNVKDSLSQNVGSVRFADSGVGRSSAGIINGFAGVPASGGNMTVNLMMPDGNVFARYYLPSFIDVAKANGTPIANPT